jgi:putative restriction endonuclease
MTKNKDYYIKKFAKLKQGVTKYGPAPHKAVMLLSVIQAIEKGYVSENRIYVTPLLVSLFKTTWNALVLTKHVPTFALPFFHLKSEGFWHLHVKSGFENWLKGTKSLSSFNQLRIAVDYASLDGELFILLSIPQSRNQLKQILLETYFEDSRYNWNLLSGKSYIDDITDMVVNEQPAEYAANIDKLEATLDKDSFSEEVFIRSGAFKKEISRIYNHTCCISGLRIDSTAEVSMIDACHIVPFAQSHDDTISNGLALCPTLHRAFDRHLINIDDDYRVVVSKSFIERCDSPYSIQQFEGKHILLPANGKYYPSQENLHRHRVGLIA